MARLTITTMPKCTVSMPSAFTTGIKSGVSSRIARIQNERTNAVSDVSSSTATQSASELLPDALSRNSTVSPMMATPEIQAPERRM